MSIAFPNYHNIVKNQFEVSIKHVRLDIANDYFNKTFSSYFQKERIIHESSCIDSLQQNGVAKKKNGYLLNVTRALLFKKNVLKTYWG